MTKKRSVKRALITSVISLFLCVAMLVGTTYAWFTDSATSANNVIKSGNLDVELEYWNGTEWKDITNKADILTNTLWEPGTTEIAYLRVANAGSLALKYQLGINVVSEIYGKNVAGESFKLSDYIMFGVVEGVNGETGAYADREAAVAAVTNAQKISAGYTKASTMAAGADALYLALVVYMPTTVGNEANHDGANVPQIDLGINIFATQAEAELDSFGSDYDKDAVWADAYAADAAGLVEAIAEAEDGAVIALTDDIVLNATSTYSARAVADLQPIVVAKDKSITINLNGKNIIATSTKDSGNQYAFQVKGDLTVEGEGTISISHAGANMGWNALVAAFSVEGGTLTLGEGVTVLNNGGSDMAYAVDVNTTLGESVLNLNGAALCSSYVGVRIFNNNKTEKGIVNYNSGIIQGEKNGYDIWAQLMSAPAENAVVNFADGIEYDTAEKSGTMYYVEAESLVYNEATLKAALTNGGNYTVISDIAVDAVNTITVPEGVTAVIDLNGKTVAGLSEVADKNDDGKINSADNQVMIDVRGDLTVKNGTMTIKHTADNYGWNACTEVFYVAANGSLTVDNATIENLGGSDMAYAIDLVNAKNLTLNVTNSVLKSSYIAVRVFNNASGNGVMNNVTIKNTELVGTSRALWVHIYSSADNGGKGVKDAPLNLNFFRNGNTFKADNPNRIIEFGFTDEINFDADGRQIVTATTLAEVMAYAKNGNVVIDAQGANLGDFSYDGTFGNGTVLKNAKFTYVYGASVDGVATFENCEFVSDHSYSANFSDGSYTGKVIFNNCYFDGWNSFGTAITSVEMNNCTFETVVGPYSLLRFYQDAVLNNCVIMDSFDGVDTNMAGTVVEFNNCTGIEGKIYNNTSGGVVQVGTWIVDGVVLTDVPAW